MSELIQALAIEAKDYADGIVNQGGEFHSAYTQKLTELIVRQCGYYADIFESLGCPGDMDPTETKPSDYVKKQFGVGHLC